MHLFFEPHTTSFNLILETEQYHQIWHTYELDILTAFTAATGLHFQQTEIRAEVFDDARNNAGKPDAPMHLSGQHYTSDEKLATLLHELSHRLLGGNGLGPVSLGLTPEGIDDPLGVIYEHRHVYLFLFNVGERLRSASFRDFMHNDERRRNKNDPYYADALIWASTLTDAQRANALKHLMDHAVPRTGWDDLPDVIPPRDAEDWFKYLITEL